MLAAIT